MRNQALNQGYALDYGDARAPLPWFAPGEGGDAVVPDDSASQAPGRGGGEAIGSGQIMSASCAQSSSGSLIHDLQHSAIHHTSKIVKGTRERYDQNKCSYSILHSLDSSVLFLYRLAGC